MSTILVVANETLAGASCWRPSRSARAPAATDPRHRLRAAHQAQARQHHLRRLRLRRGEGAHRPGPPLPARPGHQRGRRHRRPRSLHRDDGRRRRAPPRRDHHLDLPGDGLGLAAPRPDRAHRAGQPACRSPTSSRTSTPRASRSTSRSSWRPRRRRGDELLDCAEGQGQARPARHLFIVDRPAGGRRGPRTRPRAGAHGPGRRPPASPRA